MFERQSHKPYLSWWPLLIGNYDLQSICTTPRNQHTTKISTNTYYTEFHLECWLYGNYSIVKIIIAKKFSTLGKYVVYFHIMSIDLVAWFLNSASCNTFSCINSIVLYDMINECILDHTWSIQYVIKSSFQYFCYLR